MGNILKKLKNKYKNSPRITRHSTKKAFVLFMLLLIPFTLHGNALALSAEEARQEYERLNRENQQLREGVDLRSQEIRSYSQVVSALNARIATTQSEINTANARIAVLNNEIIETEKRIKEEDEKLSIRQVQLGNLIKEIYIEGQLGTVEVIVRSSSFSDFVNRTEYLEQMNLGIKEETTKITEIKKRLELEKQTLAENKKSIEETRQRTIAQQSDLLAQRSLQSSLISMTESSRRAFENNIRNNNQRMGVLGCIIFGGCEGDASGEIIIRNNSFPYFSQLDLRWSGHVYAPGCNSCTIGNFGCLIASLAMVRTFFGNYTTPPAEARFQRFTSDGLMFRPWNIAGRQKRVLGVNWNSINQSLDQGRPVVVGIRMTGFNYWSHYIVLYGRSGDTYFANDPAFGAGRTYNISRVFEAVSSN